MGVAEALGPLLDAQTPKRRDASTARRPVVATPKRSDVATPRRSDAQTPKRLAKSLDSRYSKKTLYVLTETMDDAWHRYRKEGGKEESELVERLLREFAAGGFRG
jgi:hypothetical protein